MSGGGPWSMAMSHLLMSEPNWLYNSLISTWLHYSVVFASEMMDVCLWESNGFATIIYPQESLSTRIKILWVENYWKVIIVEH